MLGIIMASCIVAVDAPLIVHRYNTQDFYCYTNNVPKGITVLPKVLVLFTQKPLQIQTNLWQRCPVHKEQRDKFMVRFLRDYGSLIVKIEPQGDHVLVHCDSLKSSMKILNELPAYQRTFIKNNFVETYPVVLWENRECVPADKINLNVKQSLVARNENYNWSNLIVRKLRKFGDFDVSILKSSSSTSFSACIEKLKSPPNIFILSNILSEDEWFDGACPEFIPLNPLIINGIMRVVPEGATTIGTERILILQISMSETVEFNENMVPQLGQGDFFPQWQSGPSDWDFSPVSPSFLEVRNSKPKIKKLKQGKNRLLEFRWEFQCLRSGKLRFQNVVIPYVHKGKEDFFVAQNASFTTSSVLNDDMDIQPLHHYKIKKSTMRSGKHNPWMKNLALALLIGGATMVIGPLGLVVRQLTKPKQKLKTSFYESNWQRLRNHAEFCTRNHANVQWNRQYDIIFRDLRKVLPAIGFNATVESSDVSEEPLRNILEELEKLYQLKDLHPSDNDLLNLSRNLLEFADQNV